MTDDSRIRIVILRIFTTRICTFSKIEFLKTVKRSQCVSLALPRVQLRPSLLHSIVFHMISAFRSLKIFFESYKVIYVKKSALVNRIKAGACFRRSKFTGFCEAFLEGK